VIDQEKVRAITDQQAEDDSLWFAPRYITEDILQRALRRLHAAIEGDWKTELAMRIDND
jgi:hypothetical protein